MITMMKLHSVNVIAGLLLYFAAACYLEYVGSGVNGFIAFVPPSSLSPSSPAPSVARQQQQEQRWRLFASSTVKEKEKKKKQEEERRTLSTEDEAILFGQDDSVVHPTGAIRKKDRFGNVLPAERHHALDERESELLDHAGDPLINKLHTTRSTVQSCPELWSALAEHCPERRALFDEHLCDEKIDWSFAEMHEKVQKSAAVFSDLGVRRNVNVAVLGENSAHWLLADHGIQMAGGASAVRGADAPVPELQYIYRHCDSAGLVVLQGPRLLQRLAKAAAAANDIANDSASDAAKDGIASDAANAAAAANNDDAATGDEPSGDSSTSSSSRRSLLGLSNDKYGPVKTVILMHREKKTDEEIAKMAAEYDVDVALLSDLVDKVDIRSSSVPSSFPRLARDDLATIVYTSGTTGNPKGVMLTHGNLLHQTEHRLAPSRPYEETEPCPGDVTVALLPVWHITERTFELWMLSRGCQIVYSSIRHFKDDLAKHRPQFQVLVPRVLEKVASGVQDKFNSGGAAVRTLAKLFTATGNMACKHSKIARDLVAADEPVGALGKLKSKAIVAALSPLNAVGDKLVWSKVQQGFGGRLKCMIAGGSALSGQLETFYETAGLTVCVGYGLTECSPLVSFRRSDANLITAGCAGKPCSETEIRIVDPETKKAAASSGTERQPLPDGEVGVVIVRGPQVMRGYYQNPEATAEAVDAFGFFDTGDLGRINPVTGDLILTGRAKDTIVLSNGENIEPQPIEDAILSECSPLVEQVMLTGQDGRRLVAICVLSPKELAASAGGYLDAQTAKRLQKANEIVNNPKCTAEDCETSCEQLNEVTAGSLRNNRELRSALLSDVARATQPFRKWERVGEVHVTLEPFAMANGQLTQSYKVKRNAVTKRYQQEI